MSETSDRCESIEATERFVQTSNEGFYPDEIVKRVTQNIRNRADASCKETHRLLELLDDVVTATRTADNSAVCNKIYSLDLLKIHTSVQMCVNAVENLLVSVNLMKENAGAIGSSVKSRFTKSSTDALNSVSNDDNILLNGEPSLRLKKDTDGKSVATKCAKGLPVMGTRRKTSALSLGNPSALPKDKSVPHQNLQKSSSGAQETNSSHLNNDRTNADEIFCSCQSVAYGDMIMCDSPHCGPKWFHFKCVHLKSAPKGKWFCPACASQETQYKTRAQVNVAKKTSSVPKAASKAKNKGSSLKGQRKRQPSFRRQVVVSSLEKRMIPKFGKKRMPNISKAKKTINATKNGAPKIIAEGLRRSSRKSVASSGMQQETGLIDDNHISNIGDPKNGEPVIDVCN